MHLSRYSSYSIVSFLCLCLEYCLRSPMYILTFSAWNLCHRNNVGIMPLLICYWKWLDITIDFCRLIARSVFLRVLITHHIYWNRNSTSFVEITSHFFELLTFGHCDRMDYWVIRTIWDCSWYGIFPLPNKKISIFAVVSCERNRRRLLRLKEILMRLLPQ